MDEINMFFGGSLSTASKTQEKSLKGRHIEPDQRMKWSEVGISFGPEDNPTIELSNKKIPFMVQLSIGWHKVDKTLIDNGASLNLIMRKTFIKMCLNLVDLTLVH
jgi:hypothetical protein